MKKLKLNKKTISVLENEDMNNVNGGVGNSTILPSSVILTHTCATKECTDTATCTTNADKNCVSYPKTKFC